MKPLRKLMPVSRQSSCVVALCGRSVRCISRLIFGKDIEAMAENAGDKPPEADKPADQPPAADKPAETPPTADKPAEQPPAADKPAETPPTADKPAEQPPAADKPPETPAADKPAEPAPTAAADKPPVVEEKLAEKKPPVEQSVGEKTGEELVEKKEKSEKMVPEPAQIRIAKPPESNESKCPCDQCRKAGCNCCAADSEGGDSAVAKALRKNMALKLPAGTGKIDDATMASTDSFTNNLSGKRRASGKKGKKEQPSKWIRNLSILAFVAGLAAIGFFAVKRAKAFK